MRYNIQELSISRWQTFKPLKCLCLREAPGALRMRNLPILLSLTCVTDGITKRSCHLCPLFWFCLPFLCVKRARCPKYCLQAALTQGDLRTQSLLKSIPLAVSALLSQVTLLPKKRDKDRGAGPRLHTSSVLPKPCPSSAHIHSVNTQEGQFGISKSLLDSPQTQPSLV